MFVNIPPTRKWGSLLFMWIQGVDIELVYMDGNVMALLVYSDPLHNPWLINLVYCPLKVEKNGTFGPI